jgi:glycosyltransferase involved in cell wall biosynthesis
MASTQHRSQVDISIVIPTFNRRNTLARTLPTTLQQSLSSSRYEVIVVVDGSTDGTADLLRSYEDHPGLRFAQQLNRGQAAARNAGLALATGRLVLFLDDDLLCAPVLLDEHLRAHDLRSSPALVFGPVGLSGASRPGLATSWIRADVELTMSRLARQRPVDGLMDVTVYPNSSVDRRLILECGGFDERFVGAGEDTELGLRLWKEGVEFCYAPDARTEQIFEKTAWRVLFHEAPAY